MSTMHEIETITRVRLRMTLRDLAGDIADPTQLVFSIKEPSGDITTYIWGIDDEVVRDSEGIFYVDWDASEVGTHYYKWQANGAVQLGKSAAFSVKESPSGL